MKTLRTAILALLAVVGCGGLAISGEATSTDAGPDVSDRHVDSGVVEGGFVPRVSCDGGATSRRHARALGLAHGLLALNQIQRRPHAGVPRIGRAALRDARVVAAVARGRARLGAGAVGARRRDLG